jgi:hypothetical protein
MTRDRLTRLLLRLAIVFVGLQIVVFVAFLVAFACFALGLADPDVPASALLEPGR